MANEVERRQAAPVAQNVTTTEIINQLMRTSVNMQGVDLDPHDTWIKIFPQSVQLAALVADTEFVPKTLRGRPEAICALFVAGHEYGMGPTESLKNLFMIDGAIGQYASYMRGRVLAAGHEIEEVEVSDHRVIVRGRRRNSNVWHTASYTADEAKKRGISLNGSYGEGGKWKYTPQDKLYARATGRLIRRHFADCIIGLPTELEATETDWQTDNVSITAERPTAPVSSGGTRVVQRNPVEPQKPSQEAPESPVTRSTDSVGTGTPPEPPEDGDEGLRITAEQAQKLLGEQLGARPIPDDDPEAERPSNATQWKNIGIAMGNNVNFKGETTKTLNREDSKLAVSWFIGRRITTLKDLTFAEAQRVLKWAATFDGAEKRGERTFTLLDILNDAVVRWDTEPDSAE